MPALTASLLVQFGIASRSACGCVKASDCIFLPHHAETKGAGWKAVQLM